MAARCGSATMSASEFMRCTGISAASRAWIRAHFRPPDHLEVGGTLLVVVDERADIAVLRLVRPAVGREHPGVAWLALLWLVGVAAEMLAEHDLQQVLEHRYVDALSLARLLPVVERRRYDACDLLADGAVGDDDGRIARRLGALHLEQRRDAGRALDEIVVRCLGGIRAALAVAEAADVDDTRISG